MAFHLPAMDSLLLWGALDVRVKPVGGVGTNGGSSGSLTVISRFRPTTRSSRLLGVGSNSYAWMR